MEHHGAGHRAGRVLQRVHHIADCRRHPLTAVRGEGGVGSCRPPCLFLHGPYSRRRIQPPTSRGVPGDDGGGGGRLFPRHRHAARALVNARGAIHFYGDSVWRGGGRQRGDAAPLCPPLALLWLAVDFLRLRHRWPCLDSPLLPLHRLHPCRPLLHLPPRTSPPPHLLPPPEGNACCYPMAPNPPLQGGVGMLCGTHVLQLGVLHAAHTAALLPLSRSAV
mmetsp:Transcript_46630/g.95392  ORF Transcript_46630/g.95392 Transcript_46630/m.95392 type:complete len:220 (-) Transcript_46630:682-1341(-)